eukprot:4344143-Amphidinium_carterae.2
MTVLIQGDGLHRKHQSQLCTGLRHALVTSCEPTVSRNGRSSEWILYVRLSASAESRKNR